MKGPAQYEWLVSRVCDEFHCLPSAAIRELDDSPPGDLEAVLVLRAYARAVEAYDRVDGDISKLEQSSLLDLVIEHEADLVRHG